MTTDPLATLLHRWVCSSAPHTHARIKGYWVPMCKAATDDLRAAGVTLTQPQPATGIDVGRLIEAIRATGIDSTWTDFWNDLGPRIAREYAAIRSTPAAPKPDKVADVRSRISALMFNHEVDPETSTEILDAFDDALRSTPAAPKEDDRG